MKILCVRCDEPMRSQSSEGPERGSLLAVTFVCPQCGKRVGLLTNPAETQLAMSLGYKVGGRQTPAGPMEMVQRVLVGGQEMPADEAEPVWSGAALKRLSAAPTFVQGMVRRLYTDYAKQKGYTEITPAVMNEAREMLGMTGM